MGQPYQDLGELQTAERAASSKPQRGAKRGVLGDRKKDTGPGEWGSRGKLGGGVLGVSWKSQWEPDQVDLIDPLEHGLCSSCKGVLNQRRMWYDLHRMWYDLHRFTSHCWMGDRVRTEMESCVCGLPLGLRNSWQ